jgi:hypothetical protein
MTSPKQGAATPGPALSPEQIVMLRQIESGADVWGYQHARILRDIERLHPQLIKIGKAKNAPKNGALQRPYFGAIATKAGKALLAKYAAALAAAGQPS